ncbi:hypothetical protein Ae201684P_008569 [Aphanomyces euteiches]|uniref:Uncharacterized protein n=1 Tax=Aphanomyces euteiches TaxID=100861 RepID=A0A6G0XQ33_9STRA|nr:hypothetical protein Ae201684_002516 [Aphanomyces euteiches]KAH9092903.1 hypothetical protein Ae201684P_008569 [Aphanomyces euteiches]
MTDALLKVKDLLILKSLRGRPRQVATGQANQGVSTPMAPKKATNPAPRLVSASIRRHRSSFERATQQHVPSRAIRPRCNTQFAAYSTPQQE